MVLPELAKTMIEHVGVAAGSGVGGFVGAFWRFKARLDATEKSVQAVVIDQLPKVVHQLEVVVESIVQLHKKLEENRGEERKELGDLRASFELRFEHLEDLDEAEEKGRKSRPDPLEDLYARLSTLERQVRETNKRDGRHVREDRFSEFVKEQDASWRKMERTLGEIQGILASTLNLKK